jgi:hypothetical protein
VLLGFWLEQDPLPTYRSYLSERLGPVTILHEVVLMLLSVISTMTSVRTIPQVLVLNTNPHSFWGRRNSLRGPKNSQYSGYIPW